MTTSRQAKIPQVDTQIKVGATLEEIFKLVKSIEAKAAKGDKNSQRLLKTAYDRWGSSQGYAF